jgi:predicted TIM-barrel fold metal-dependent hydrolase
VELTDLLVTLGDRIVLGSDFSNTPYPHGEQLAGLVRLDLGEAWLRAVRPDNATVLLGLPCYALPTALVDHPN